jgi:hypothetical protein
MYFLELEDGTHINLYGLRKWKGDEEFLALYYKGKEQVILKGDDARRARACLRGFTIPLGY